MTPGQPTLMEGTDHERSIIGYIEEKVEGLDLSNEEIRRNKNMAKI